MRETGGADAAKRDPGSADTAVKDLDYYAVSGLLATTSVASMKPCGSRQLSSSVFRIISGRLVNWSKRH